MDDDDPERRIAELESRRASTGDRDLTADDVHNTAFSKPPLGKRGYDEDSVDALMARLEQQLRNPTAAGALTADDVYAVTFPKPAIGRRGYHEDEVDEFLDRITQQLPPGDGVARQQASDRPPPAERRGRKPWLVLLIVVLASVPLYYFGHAAYDFYGYSVGSPAVATVTSCPIQHSSGRRSGGLYRMLRSRVCTGTWIVDGQSYTGEIEGPRDGYLVGELVHVRARGNEAFTSVGISWRFLAGTIPLLLIGLVGGYILWLRRLRSRR